jgi:hypothetical protein
LAEGWLACAERVGRGEMEHIMRTAVKIVRVRNEILDLSALPDPELEATIAMAFERAAEAAP